MSTFSAIRGWYENGGISQGSNKARERAENLIFSVRSARCKDSSVEALGTGPEFPALPRVTTVELELVDILGASGHLGHISQRTEYEHAGQADSSTVRRLLLSCDRIPANAKYDC